MACRAAALSQRWTWDRDSRLDLVLVGKTGNGKSSTGNKILDGLYFKESYDTGSETKCVGVAWNYIEGRYVFVCDTPGLCDTDMDEKQSYDQTKQAFVDGLKSCHEGFHAVALVLSISVRMTKEEQDTVQQIERMLGGNVLKDYGIIIFTGGDNFPSRTKGKVTFEEWCRNQKGPLKAVLEACNYRCILFDNVTKDVSELSRQRLKMFSVIDDLQYQRRRYTSKMLEAVQAEWEKAKREGKKPEIAKDVCLEIGSLREKLENVHETKKCDSEVSAELRAHLERIEELIAQLDEDEKKKVSTQIHTFHSILDRLDSDGADSLKAQKESQFAGTYVPSLVCGIVDSKKPLEELPPEKESSTSSCCIL